MRPLAEAEMGASAVGPRTVAATSVRADSLVVVVMSPLTVRAAYVDDVIDAAGCALSRDSHRTAARTSIRVSSPEKQRIVRQAAGRAGLFSNFLRRRAGGQ
jgi:hypothetical protein